MVQNATLLRKSAPGPPNISDEHVSCIAPATENASLQILFKCPTPANAFETATNPHVLLTFVFSCFFHNLLCLAGIYMHKQREFPFKRVACSASNVISIYVFEWTQNYNRREAWISTDHKATVLRGLRCK